MAKRGRRMAAPANQRAVQARRRAAPAKAVPNRRLGAPPPIGPLQRTPRRTPPGRY